MGHIRLILHAILVGILKIDRIMRRQKIVVINPAQLEALHRVTSPMLFAPTHCGKYDIQVMGEVLGRHQWALLSGDPHELPGTIEGTWLQLNGVIYVDRDDTNWRHRAKAEMIERLKQGGNMLIFPEGTWNFSENQPVLPLFRGVVDAARETGALIVPFALEIVDDSNTYYVNVGAPMHTLDLSALRDAMATLKWELWEHCNVFEEHSRGYMFHKWKEYITNRLGECDYMEFNLIWKYAYHDRNIITTAEAFEHLQYLIPCRENAFLFRGRNLNYSNNKENKIAQN